jgi:hypothetical protein
MILYAKINSSTTKTITFFPCSWYLDDRMLKPIGFIIQLNFLELYVNHKVFQ